MIQSETIEPKERERERGQSPLALQWRGIKLISLIVDGLNCVSRGVFSAALLRQTGERERERERENTVAITEP